jgi:hypothetical protein
MGLACSFAGEVPRLCYQPEVDKIPESIANKKLSFLVITLLVDRLSVGSCEISSLSNGSR